EGSQVETVEQALAGQVVLDIRHPGEEELKPLELEGVEVLKVPFYQLNSRFAELDPARAYLLYCEKGVMSRLHAQYLLDRVLANVRVLRLPSGCVRDQSRPSVRKCRHCGLSFCIMRDSFFPTDLLVTPIRNAP